MKRWLTVVCLGLALLAATVHCSGWNTVPQKQSNLKIERPTGAPVDEGTGRPDDKLKRDGRLMVRER